MNTNKMYIIINYKSTRICLHVNNTPNADQNADNAVCIQWCVYYVKITDLYGDRFYLILSKCVLLTLIIETGWCRGVEHRGRTNIQWDLILYCISTNINAHKHKSI